MALQESEHAELVRILDKIESREIKGDIWHALVKKFITVAIELCILDDQGKVFMVYRKDQEFDGFHIPGTVINEWETAPEALDRLIQSEINQDAGLEITYPESIGWVDSPKDAGPAEPSPRHGILLMHYAKLKGDFIPKEGMEEKMGFFPWDALPHNTLGCHKYLLPYFRNHFETGKPILGKMSEN